MPGTYLRLGRSWAIGDRVVLELPMEGRITVADERIDAVRGCGAVEVGPLVYCFEDHDQQDGVSVDDIVLDGTHPTLTWRPELLGGVTVVELDGGRRNVASTASAYHGQGAHIPATPTKLTAIPYHAWGNRGVRAMRVWAPLSGTGPT
jgi:uncharacterized protein